MAGRSVPRPDAPPPGENDAALRCRVRDDGRFAAQPAALSAEGIDMGKACIRDDYRFHSDLNVSFGASGVTVRLLK